MEISGCTGFERVFFDDIQKVVFVVVVKLFNIYFMFVRVNDATFS